MNRGFIVSILLIILFLFLGFIQTAFIHILLTPVVFTPYIMVGKIMNLMGVKDGDIVYELGFGKGDILFEARRRAKILGVGYEVSPILTVYAKIVRFLKFGFKSNIVLKTEDFINADIEKADKIYVYLSEGALAVLRPVFAKKLKDNAQIFSYKHKIPGVETFKEFELEDGDFLYVYGVESF